MENLWICGVSVFVFFTLWLWLGKSTSAWGHIKRVGLLTLLFAPINIDGNVFTLLGSATSAKSIYSVFSMHQRADEDAVALIGLMPRQKAGRDALVGFGLVGYQKASRMAGISVGLVGYQKAKDAIINAGFAVYQNAKLSAKTGAAVAFYQKVGDQEKAFAVWSETRAGNATE